MSATILTIGSEVLAGDILNKNARNFSIELNDLGFKVEKHISIDDDFNMVVKTIQEEVESKKVILITGGLGPTKDDLTKAAVARAIDKEKLVLNYESYTRLISYFKNRKLALESNLSQAYFPNGSIVLKNYLGTADGFMIEHNETIIVVLPGPPRENLPMFNKKVRPILATKTDRRYISKYYRIYGIGEWETELRIKDLIDGSDEIATFARTEGLFIKVRLDESEYEDYNDRFEYYEKILKDRFGDNFIEEGVKTTEELLGKCLINNNISISTAESITGGLISSKLVSVPGISSVMSESYVTYSNEVKTKVLGVNKETIDKFDVVSKETVEEMLYGLKKLTNSDLCIASSGYAGPGEKAGLVYYGALYKDQISIIKKQYVGSRNEIREICANDAIMNAYILINSQNNEK